MTERIIPNFKNYKINTNGLVLNLKTNREVALTNKPAGLSVHLSNGKKRKRYFIHKLMGDVFLKAQDGDAVFHIDGDKTNNNLSNLKLVCKDFTPEIPFGYRKINGFNRYAINKNGNIISLEKVVKNRCNSYSYYKENDISLQVNNLGYIICTLKDDYDNTKTVYVHRIVAKEFIYNTNDALEVNHKDGNKANNCVDNLEWVTKSENIRHAWCNGMGNNQWTKAAK